MRDLFSSPLVTQAARSKTFVENEQPIGISRREHFCVALSNRLGLSDICGLDATTLTGVQTSANRLSLSLPEASYSRGAEAPTTARDPSLFFRAGTENLCRLVADQVVDMGAMPKYSSANSMVAIDDFVKTVMALPPSDARSAPARQILLDHYNTALTMSGIMPRDALKSTFVLACTSPTSVSIGL